MANKTQELFQEKKDFAELESIARFGTSGMLKEFIKLIKYFFIGAFFGLLLVFLIKNFGGFEEYLGKIFFDFSFWIEKINIFLKDFGEKKYGFFLIFILVSPALYWLFQKTKIEIKQISANLLHFTLLKKVVFGLFGFLFILQLYGFEDVNKNIFHKFIIWLNDIFQKDGLGFFNLSDVFGINKEEVNYKNLFDIFQKFSTLNLNNQIYYIFYALSGFLAFFVLLIRSFVGIQEMWNMIQDKDGIKKIGKKTFFILKIYISNIFLSSFMIFLFYFLFINTYTPWLFILK